MERRGSVQTQLTSTLETSSIYSEELYINVKKRKN